ncbi:458_t:CDS:2 [Entrophospora sp. SA101]|nr:458_t:CDS:2 [Entrophospora sp. SA101]
MFCLIRDIPEEDLLKVANEWKFPLETEYAKSLITINAPPEPPGLSADPPGPKRALRRQKRVLHIVERFSLFLHNMLAVNYYYSHDWDKLQKVADDVEQYLEDLGWVQFYRGQMDRGIDSIMVSTVQADQEFEAIAFEDFTRKLRTDIAAVSTIKTSWTSLIQDQLNFFCLQQYIMDKFKPPSKWQLAEYLSVVLFGNI